VATLYIFRCSTNSVAANGLVNKSSKLGRNLTTKTDPCHYFSTFEPTTPDEIKSIILSLKDSSASGYDGVKSKFLKKNVDFFAEFLSNQINAAFDSGAFPDVLKIARVIPIFKNGSKSEISNYSNGAHSSIVENCGYSNQNWHVTGSCIGPSRVHNCNNLIYLSL
jgi:hypothetical protein